MKVYFSGIAGTGLSPLANLCLKSGWDVYGSDNNLNQNTDNLSKLGCAISKDQTGRFLNKVNEVKKIDWFIHTSALKADHPELLLAKKLELKVSKRDEILNSLLSECQLNLIAIAGTHGKTGTASLLVWLFKSFNLSISYAIGSDLSWSSSSDLDLNSKYFVYECDEFDKNFLQFNPQISIITSIDYDHVDTYPTINDYYKAFHEFVSKKSQKQVFLYQEDCQKIPSNQNFQVFQADQVSKKITLPGNKIKQNAFLVLQLFQTLFPSIPQQDIIQAINNFPGVKRRMEKIALGVYSDYAHHPAEIRSMLSIATEINKNVIIVYQPHQNIRQHSIRNLYQDCFGLAKKVYWLPTYLSRENHLPILTPEYLIKNVQNTGVETAEMDNNLINKLKKHHRDGDLIVFVGAGDIDDWARNNFLQN